MNLIEIKENEKLYYGGNQDWFASKQKRAVGCGIIACTNTLCHMAPAEKLKKPIQKDRYMTLAEKMGKKFILIIPFFGVNGFSLSMGMNRAMRYFGKKGHAHWGCLPKNLDKNIDKMLAKGLPVTLAIGPSFPYFVKKSKLNFYQKKGDNYVIACKVTAHYVSITENLKDYYKISSWGRCYYIDKEEYKEYAKKKSNWLFSNILVINT